MHCYSWTTSEGGLTTEYQDAFGVVAVADALFRDGATAGLFPTNDGRPCKVNYVPSCLCSNVVKKTIFIYCIIDLKSSGKLFKSSKPPLPIIIIKIGGLLLGATFIIMTVLIF